MNIFKRDTYRRILDNMSGGVYSVDVNRKISFWSKGLESLTGIAFDSVKDKSINDKNIVYED